MFDCRFCPDEHRWRLQGHSGSAHEHRKYSICKPSHTNQIVQYLINTTSICSWKPSTSICSCHLRRISKRTRKWCSSNRKSSCSSTRSGRRATAKRRPPWKSNAKRKGTPKMPTKKSKYVDIICAWTLKCFILIVFSNIVNSSNGRGKEQTGCLLWTEPEKCKFIENNILIPINITDKCQLSIYAKIQYKEKSNVWKNNEMKRLVDKPRVWFISMFTAYFHYPIWWKYVDIRGRSEWKEKALEAIIISMLLTIAIRTSLSVHYAKTRNFVGNYEFKWVQILMILYQVFIEMV